MRDLICLCQKSEKNSSKNNSKTVKYNEFLHRSGSLVMFTQKTSSTASLVPLESDGEKYILRDSTIGSCEVPLKLMEKLGIFFQRVSSERQTHLPNIRNGCIHDSLGSASRSNACIGCLVKGSNFKAHKLHRNDGSVLAIQHFQNVLKGQKVLIKTDKTTVMTNINKQRWTHSPYLCILLVGYHQQ